MPAIGKVKYRHSNQRRLLFSAGESPADEFNEFSRGHHLSAYYKAMAELRTLQTNRKLKDTLVEEEAKEVPALASVNVLLRQARSQARQQAMTSDYELEQFAHEAMLRARAAVHNEPTARPAGPPKEVPNAA